MAADRYPVGPPPPGSAAALFDFLEEALHLFQLLPDLVDPHAEISQRIATRRREITSTTAAVTENQQRRFSG
jgi:hypothetical protein